VTITISVALAVLFSIQNQDLVACRWRNSRHIRDWSVFSYFWLWLM